MLIVVYPKYLNKSLKRLLRSMSQTQRTKRSIPQNDQLSFQMQALKICNRVSLTSYPCRCCFHKKSSRRAPPPPPPPPIDDQPILIDRVDEERVSEIQRWDMTMRLFCWFHCSVILRHLVHQTYKSQVKCRSRIGASFPEPHFSLRVTRSLVAE